MAELILKVATFSHTPGPRERSEGLHSGEEFLEDQLLPLFKKAIVEGCSLLVDLDGTAGYATSFLEAAFGGLARQYSPEKVLEIIRFKSEDEPYLVDEIKHYVVEANSPISK